MTAFEPIFLPLPLEETCNEVSASMQREGFIPKERHDLNPEEVGLSDAGSRRLSHIVILDFEPPGLEGNASLNPLHAALYLCQIVCQTFDPQVTKITFNDYESIPFLDEDITSDFAMIVTRRLQRVHNALARRV